MPFPTNLATNDTLTVTGPTSFTYAVGTNNGGVAKTVAIPGSGALIICQSK